MAKTLVARQQEYREKRSKEATRISVWISNKANARLATMAATQRTSREKVIERLLEQVI